MRFMTSFAFLSFSCINDECVPKPTRHQNTASYANCGDYSSKLFLDFIAKSCRVGCWQKLSIDHTCLTFAERVVRVTGVNCVRSLWRKKNSYVGHESTLPFSHMNSCESRATPLCVIVAHINMTRCESLSNVKIISWYISLCNSVYVVHCPLVDGAQPRQRQR